jgi:hypothetical protein
MDTPAQKKGLSKGCTIGLIVGGIILVLVVAVIILIIAKKDDLAAWAYSKAVIHEKTLIAKSEIPGIDTVEVNRIADEFLIRVDTARYTQFELNPFMLFVQEYGTDEKMDSAEAVAFLNAMVESFPDLSQYQKTGASDDTAEPEDTTAASE